MNISIFLFYASIAISSLAFSQHTMQMPRDTTRMPQDTLSAAIDSIDMSGMPGAFSQDVRPERDASGTSWQPEAAPMSGRHCRLGVWDVMLHGSLFARYTAQNAFQNDTRGKSAYDAPNWLMLMGMTDIGEHGRFMLRGMFSLDRATEGGGGYPLLFQTGETWNGHPLVDAQHPHDLFMEFAAAYSYSFTTKLSSYLYFGYPGEPALGPPAFMHRLSASRNPDAPLGHHWQDATHITFGVATAGIRYDWAKIEGSAFTGQEPDENRFNLDKATFDSYSGRLSINPNRNLALQVSTGYLKSPEALHPTTDLHRTTASLLHVYRFTENERIAMSLVYGVNNPSVGEIERSYLWESLLNLQQVDIYSRVEFVQKDAEELDIGGDPSRVFMLNAFTLGIERALYRGEMLEVAGGVQGSTYGVVTDLQPFYGSHPWSFELFIHITPPLTAMHRMAGM